MTVAAWDALHADPRHRLEYPSEHVVRFLSALDFPPDDRHHALAVDIGCGSGRHLSTLATAGFQVSGCDTSRAAVLWARERWSVAPAFLKQAPATMLPFDDETFDVALAIGVFYYGTRVAHRRAVDEMRRVLRSGGKGFVCVRTTDDWRTGGVPAAHPEHGMAIDFITEYELRTIYGGFSDLTYERTETTTQGRTRCDSDWLITVTK